MDSKTTPDSLLFFLDSSAISHGAHLPPQQCRTTPGVLAEFRPGGATRRKLDHWLAAGLVVVSPTSPALARARKVAESAGSAARLTSTDLEIAAACLESPVPARLVTDDYTLQDLARRLGLECLPIATRGVETTQDWEPRCDGCGRTFGAGAAVPTECPVCGSTVRPRPRRNRRPKVART